MQTKPPPPQMLCNKTRPLFSSLSGRKTHPATCIQPQQPFLQAHDDKAAPDAIPAFIQFATSSFAGTRPAHITLPSTATAGTDKIPAAIIAFKSVTFSTTAVTPVSFTAAATTFSASWQLAHPGPNTLISIQSPFPNNKLKKQLNCHFWKNPRASAAFVHIRPYFSIPAAPTAEWMNQTY